MRSFHLDGLEKSGVLNHVWGAMANYLRLVRHNGPVASLKYLFFETIGTKKVIKVKYSGCDIFVRTCTPDLVVAYYCLQGGEFRILKELIGSANTIIDGGSYAGFAALALSDLFPESRILAIEPDPENFDLLVRNTASKPHIIPINAALMGETQTVTLFSPENGEWAFSAVPEVGSVKRAEIPGLSVLDLMKKFKVPHVEVLKLDIEGAEKAIFDKSKDWIGSVTVIYAELHERLVPGTTRAYFRATEEFEDVPTRGEKVCAINRALLKDSA